MEAGRDGIVPAPVAPSAAAPTDQQGMTSAPRQVGDHELGAARFRALFDRSDRPLAVVDVHGRVRQVNDAACRMLGRPRETILGRGAGELVRPVDREAEELIGEVFAGRRTSAVATIRLLVSDRSARIELTAVCDEDGNVHELLAAAGGRPRTARAIDHAEGTWPALIEGEEPPEGHRSWSVGEPEARYRAIVETAQEGILAVSPDGDVLFANRRLTEIVGLSMREVRALSRTGIFAPARAARVARRLARRAPEAGPERADLPYHHPDGTDRVLHVSASALTAADGTVLGSLAMVSDVTEQRAAEEALRRQAWHDPLTGLPNRLLFMDRLRSATAPAAVPEDVRHQDGDAEGIAVLFLDIDRFKSVNDTRGHEAGDRVLAEVATRIAGAVRATDTVARLGGDEFAIICTGAAARTTALVAERVRQTLSAPVLLDGEELFVSVSIGVAASPPHRTESLLGLADKAMYHAKATRPGGVVSYDEVPPQAADPQ